MSDDEDWFERALRDLEESVDGESDAHDGDAADGDGSGANDAEADVEAGTDDQAEAGTDNQVETETGDQVETETDGRVELDPAENGGDADGERGENGEPSTSELFGAVTDDEADPFGGAATGGSDPFGGVADGDGEDTFGEPVGDPAGGDETAFDDREFEALGGGGDAFGDEEVGFGAGGEESVHGGGAGPDFDDETFDSDIDRVDVGIEGLDEMILGGIPERSLLVAIGAAGTGKTTFGIQFLTETLREGGSAVYITLEESREAILSTAEEKGWPFREWVAEDRLAVVSLDPIEMANSLASIRSDISRLVDEFGADRLVLDSVSLLEMMYDHPATRRSEVFDFARSLKRAGVTTMLTSEASEENPYASRYGIVEYLVDAVFILQYVRPSNFRETRLAVEIQKIRDANHSRETKPYEITNDGISVYRQANIF